MRIRAAVAESPGAPMTIEDVELDDQLRDKELLVRVVACAICKADLLVRDKRVPFPLPAVLGHEGVGVVERVGANVDTVNVGDHVIMTFPNDGTCGHCLGGQPRWCDAGERLMWGGTRFDGSESALKRNGKALGGHMFQQSAFATHVIAIEHNVVVVASGLPLEQYVIGCGVMTGAGGVLNTLKPNADSTIAVFGAGGVGASAILAAKMSGCRQIIAVEPYENRRDIALELGATHSIDSRDHDVAEQIRRITGGGADFALCCAPDEKVLSPALGALAAGGTVGVIGDPGVGIDASFEISTIIGVGKTIHGINGGESVARNFLPRLIDAHQRGLFPFDRILKQYAFDDINTAISDMEAGTVIKPVLVM
ncbi:NAD(P)-dependent alcohol dehydrogenase [Mycolicibacterium mengxianglii]|uniref:NAD(P)-dependent alcohol dehydrogenase n=1 Tax=Mycolicibacterium mengxianglii TaxID=2736649 RepID=UPI0018EED5D8|nr:NAD(P)-dependent alcohol dehydrogenase [Mycolicibacterium mengxianglii]